MEGQVTHKELVDHLTDMFTQMSGEDLAEVWNEMFHSGMQVSYVGDSIYQWVQKGESDVR